MTRPLFDSEYIFGIHEPGGEQYMIDAGHPGWIVFTEGLGHNPNDLSGKDYRSYSGRGLGVMARLNNGYQPDGTIPYSSFYQDFARRCANFVAASQGCKIWIIGNEMNFAVERPSVPSGRAAAPPSESVAGEPGLQDAGPPASEKERPESGKLLSTIGGFFSSVLGGLSKDASAPASPESSPAEPVPPAEADPRGRSDPQRFSALQPASPATRAAGAGEAASAAAAATASAAMAAGAAEAPAARSTVVDGFEVITPALYAECYRLCRAAIRAVPGHQDDQVLIGAVAPWNNQTQYPGNPNGDWVTYFVDILNLLGLDGCDGFTLHTYTHGADPNLVFSQATMDAPFQNRHYHFITYRDFMNAVPAAMRRLPVYITETDQDVAWENRNSGWVKNAYGDIHWWNQQPGNQQIRALILYRWPNIDKWFIEGKQGVIDDFRDALRNDYRWQAAAAPPPPPASFNVGDILETLTHVNMRRTPGYVGKPAGDVLVTLPPASQVVVVGNAAQSMDGLRWWNVRQQPAAGQAVEGWLAEADAAGNSLVRKVGEIVEPPVVGIRPGSTVRTLAGVNMRLTPGYVSKPAGDVIAGIAAGTLLNVLDGPRAQDGLTWWSCRGPKADGVVVEGWMAETSPAGALLLEPVVQPEAPAGTFAPGDVTTTLTVVRLRKSPGYLGKPANDVVADIPAGAPVTILAGPQAADGLTWWTVETRTATGQTVAGWMAESDPNGQPLLAEPGGQPSGAGGESNLWATTTQVRMRRTPGTQGKPANDIIGELRPKTTVNLIAGPQAADGLQWRRVGGILPTGEAIGWVAERDAAGTVLIGPPAKLPGTAIPDPAASLYLGAPFRGQFGISQLWGENPAFYSQFTYDGVPLLGHNGIDFLTPTGTDLLAVDGGTVGTVGFEEGGFGHYVLLNHPWGQSLYAHLNQVGVAQGQPVSRGTVIGKSGNSGGSSGPHLHFAIRSQPFDRKDGWGGFSDPLPYMDPQDVQLPSYVQEPSRPAGLETVMSARATAAEERMPPSPMAPERTGVARP